MSHFSFDAEISNALRMDAPVNRGPMMRWQRKQAESETNQNQSVNASLNASCNTAKTPLKNKSFTQQSKTPSTGGSGGRKTPKSGGKGHNAIMWLKFDNYLKLPFWEVNHRFYGLKYVFPRFTLVGAIIKFKT